MLESKAQTGICARGAKTEMRSVNLVRQDFNLSAIRLATCPPVFHCRLNRLHVIFFRSHISKHSQIDMLLPF